MAEGRDFLFEIGTEELPAAAAQSAVKQAEALALEALLAHHIEVSPGQVRVWVTPRRIAIFVENLSTVQKNQEIAERGPVKDAAYDADGNPTKAAEGFARAKGVEANELVVREYKGREYVFAVHRKEGMPVAELIPDICRVVLTRFSFPKTMRWDGADMRFSRPVRWMVAKFGEATIEFEAAGIRSGGESRGHRFLSSGDRVAINSASGYKDSMAAANVVVDQDERRQKIIEGLATEAGKQGAGFIDPAGEVDEVMYLVEYPSVHAGVFGEEHLRLPDRVLITAMQSHQRYFPLTAEDGSLMAGFLYVMNGDPSFAPEITEGNERVLEGRIEDAEFSFDQDLKTGIEEMTGRLGSVVFHRKLGTLADKTARLESLVQTIADLLDLCGPDRQIAASAARLAKADQVSIMVQEFPDLEGYVGSVYAKMEGYPSDVCSAIEEHFLPASAGGELPRTVAGAVLAIADKVDNLVGVFSVDELPTGSRDPYGIRRAAVGLAEISRRFGFDFDLTRLLAVAHHLFIEQKADVSRDPGVTGAAFEFVCDRIQHRLTESGMPVEIVEAARAADLKSTQRLMALAEALDGFRRKPEFEDLHTAFFRSSKIAAKAGADLEGAHVDEKLFVEDAERELYQAVNDMAPQIEKLAETRRYDEALVTAAGIRPVVDRFFDDVLVMAEDENVRKNRLALVCRVAAMLLMLGDPMRVAAAPA